MNKTEKNIKKHKKGVLLSCAMSLLLAFTPTRVFAAPSPTTSNNGGTYHEIWDGKNIVLAPKGTKAYVNGLILTSMGDGRTFMTEAGNVYDADGVFQYNVNQSKVTTNFASKYEFRFSRVNDSETFAHFIGIQVDGVHVDPLFYDAKQGSVIITLHQSFIDTLTPGEHTLTVLFDDGPSISEKFTVNKGKIKNGTFAVVDTAADNSNFHMINSAGVIFCFAGAMFLTRMKKI